MQLILEEKSAIDITSNMSSIEDVLDKKNIMNGIIENLVMDVDMGNKENINKAVNFIDSDHENQKTINRQCTEEEEDPPEDVNKIESKECNTHIIEKDVKNNSKECIGNESSKECSEAYIKIENEDDKTNLKVEKYMENTPEKLSSEPAKGNAEIHNISMDEQQNVCDKMDENWKHNEKNISLNGEDENPEEHLIKIKHEINDILQKEALNLEQLNTPARSGEESNTEIKKCNIDHRESHIEKDKKKDLTVEQEAEKDNNDVKIENKKEDMCNKVSAETEIGSNIVDYVNNKLTRHLQSIEVEVISNHNKIFDEQINNKNSNLEEKLLNVELENDCMVSNISTGNENKEKVLTDIETIVVKDYDGNDDNENSKLESMDVEFVQEENDSNEDLHEKMNVDNEIHTISSENVIENLDDSSSSNNAIDYDEITEVIDKEVTQDVTSLKSKNKVIVVKEDKNVNKTKVINQETLPKVQCKINSEKSPARKSPICRLSNTLDILSDEEDEEADLSPEIEPYKDLETAPTKISETEKQAINVEDDDDIVVIDEDIGNKAKTDSSKGESSKNDIVQKRNQPELDTDAGDNKSNFMESIELSSVKNSKEFNSCTTDKVIETKDKSDANEQTGETTEAKKNLIADGFLNSTKNSLADMTREELEEFCVLKIVESIVDRSNLGEIKLKLKTMAQSFEEYSKKAMVLYKQNRDLQVVLKSIQEEQKKAPNTITPLKITRSVGMQVLMIEKSIRKKGQLSASQVNNNKAKSTLNQSSRPNKSANNNIPVPRLIPANNAATPKVPTPQNGSNNVGKQVIPIINGVKTAIPVQKLPEKRPLNKSQSTDCVDLTDDEPPTKIISRSPATPVRLVPPQNLLAPQRAQFGQTVNSPRKVYIPISSPQGSNIRPGQTFMVKAAGPRARGQSPIVPRMPQNQMRLSRIAPGHANRHPAPLPDAMKQYQPPNWKALPPAPDLKLSKVENGIVISWKIEGYQEDSYEDIASYQLYAYQETSSPPSTALWKKIGDVKALPLPMACTLTQFMSGFKYYFAVRAVDVRSRLGPFSLPGSILLLNKM